MVWALGVVEGEPVGGVLGEGGKVGPEKVCVGLDEGCLEGMGKAFDVGVHCGGTWGRWPAGDAVARKGLGEGGLARAAVGGQHALGELGR